MKRILALILSVVLICGSLIIPVLADEVSDYLANGDLLDRVYEKPDFVSIEGSHVVADCDKKSLSVSLAKQIETVTSDNGDDFIAFVGEAVSGKAVGITRDMRSAPIRIDDYGREDLALRFQFYVSDPDAIKPFGEIELTSAGKPDYSETHWSTDVAFQYITAGWNTIYLPLNMAGENRGHADLTNINYFRTYFFLSKEALFAIDNVEIVPLVVPELHEDFSSASALNSWEVIGAQASVQNGILELSVDSSAAMSTTAYDMIVTSAAFTSLELTVKIDDPLSVRSLSYTLLDTNGYTATVELDIDKLTAKDYVTYVTPLSDMKAEKGFSFELIDALTLAAEIDEKTTIHIDSLHSNVYTDVSWQDWLYDYEVEPGTYSIAVIPDIQELSMRHPDKLTTIMNWIVDNQEKENILFTIDLGDLTWNGHQGADVASAVKEYTTARAAFAILAENGMEYSVAYGNHDYTPGNPRGTALFNEYFPYETFASQDAFGGAQQEGMSDNTYYYISVGNTDYLILALEYSPDAETIAWANEVVAAHPNHTVIVSVHDYLTGTGERWPSGRTLWEQFIQKHENILLVLCGHDWSVEYSGDLVMRRDKGENGNQVYQVMANAQDIDQTRKGVGTLLMLRFSEDGSLINFNYFSPVSGYAFREVNQFTLDINGADAVKLNGVEDGQIFCGSPTLSLESNEDVEIVYGSHNVPIIDGQFKLPVTNKKYNLTIRNAFGRIKTIAVTVNEGHEGGVATEDERAVCIHCGQSYGETLAPETPPTTDPTLDPDQQPSTEQPQSPTTSEPQAQSSLTLYIIIAAVVLVIGAVAVVLILKKNKKD